MPGLYDSYQLSNSRSIPQYQGSTMPELTKVADTLENRYDTGIQQADLLDQATKTSSAATPDQPLLDSLKQQARSKLADYAQKGNYEDMWRNVAMDAKDYSTKYNTIKGNQQAIQSWQQDLQKRVGEGKLDPATAQARIAKMGDTYTGLKIDPETGEMTNHFSGAATVPNVDIPEKVNKWLQDSHAIERGWHVEKPSADGDWYVTNGSDRKKLPWSMIKPVIDAGVQLDPEVKSWLEQEHELAPYYSGLSKKMTPDQVSSLSLNSPTLWSGVMAKQDQGMDPVSALHSTVGDMHVTGKINQIYSYARKGVIDEEKNESGLKLSPLGELKQKKQFEQPGMFSVPFTDVSPGTKISSVDDFEAERGKAVTDANTARDQLIQFEHAPNVTSSGDKWFRKESDGNLTDITSDHDRVSSQIDAAQHKVGQFDMIKKAAADATNYHPEQANPAVRKQAQELADDYKKGAMDHVSKVMGNSRNGPVQIGTRTPTAEEIDNINKTAAGIATQSMAENHPAYKDYEKELISRLQPQGEGNKMFVFNEDDPAKKTLEGVANAAISNLGLKQGLISLKYASGKNAGNDLDAGDYDDLQGKFNVVGVANDARTGDTKIVLRANQDIKGKKVKGENMILSMKDVGGLDKHLQETLKPEDYHNLVMDRTLKSGLNNVAGTMNFPITDSNGAARGAVQITRKKGLNEGPGAFSMRIHTNAGWRQASFDSYEGVIEAIKQIQDQQQ